MNAVTPPPAAEPAAVPDGCIEVAGKLYMRSADGGLMPQELVPAERQLEDQMVRRIIGFALQLSGRIDRFRGHTADDIGAFQALLVEKYKSTPRGGRKGNVTFLSYDGLLKVEVRMADTLTFGSELQDAKTLIDTCINEWAQDSNAPIRLLVNRAFMVDQAGRINRNAILGLRTVEIADERWQRAMQAITDSIRVVGTKTYFRFSRRATVGDAWEGITIDLADARAPRASESDGGTE